MITHYAPIVSRYYKVPMPMSADFWKCTCVSAIRLIQCQKPWPLLYMSSSDICNGTVFQLVFNFINYPPKMQ